MVAVHRRVAPTGRGARTHDGGKRVIHVRAEAINESLEDARLNAIADERAGGPFVRVSLDDL
jgi:hypothetical protein